MISTLSDRFQRILKRCGLETFPVYIVVGLSLFGIDLATVVGLVNLFEIDPGPAQLVGRTVGAIVGFFAHRHLTFRDALQNPGNSTAVQGGGYVLVGVLTLLASPFVLLGFLSLVGDHLVIAKVLTECILVMFTFVGLRVVFREQRTRDVAP